MQEGSIYEACKQVHLSYHLLLCNNNCSNENLTNLRILITHIKEMQMKKWPNAGKFSKTVLSIHLSDDAINYNTFYL